MSVKRSWKTIIDFLGFMVKSLIKHWQYFTDFLYLFVPEPFTWSSIFFIDSVAAPKKRHPTHPNPTQTKKKQPNNMIFINM